jgi:hypothetical protein
VLDKEAVGPDKSMGKGSIGIVGWVTEGSFECQVELFDKLGKLAGYVLLSAKVWRIEFAKNGATQDAAAMKGAQNSKPRSGRGMLDQNGAPYANDQILDAFLAFDLDKNNYIGAAEIKFILVSIGERVTDEEVRP